MTAELKIMSSMATRQLLADLAEHVGRSSAQPVALESVGGVDAAKRIEEGEPFDGVVLASNAIDKLIASGRAVAGSRVDLVRSGVSIAVRGGAQRPPIASADDVRQAVLAAASISYSTGPSGVHLAQVFERWGIADRIKSRIVKAPPGVPVGSLVAKGEVELGFQQYSELMSLPGIDILGPLPPEIQVVTIFSGAVTSISARADAVRTLLAAWAAPDTADIKRRNGMDPA